MKGKKIIVPVLLASLVASPAVAGVNALTSKVLAEGGSSTSTPLQVAGPDAKITGYTAVVNKSETDSFKVPTISSADVVSIKMTTPYGTEKVVNSGDTISNLETGYYTFSYEISNTGSISSVYEELTVYVKGDSYSMSMRDNSYFVVPGNLKFTTGGTTVKFPVPEVFKNGEEETTPSGTIQLVITKPNGTEVDPITSILTDTATGEKYLEYKFEEEGRYRVKYKYVVAGSVVATIGSTTVKLSSSYNVDDIELDFSLVSSMPTSATIGKEVTLPEINVFDKQNSAKFVDAYTKITVQYVGNENVSDAERTQVITDYKFTPKYAGTYVISYEGIIPMWNKTTGVRTYRIKDVRDTQVPAFYLTDSYSVDANGSVLVNSTDISDMEIEDQLLQLNDRSNWLDAYYEVDAQGKVTVAIPALYATDESSDINQIIANSTRELYKKGSSSNKLTLVNAPEGSNLAKINEVAYFTFSNTADANGNVWGADEDNYYIVKYVISDALGNKTTKSYNLYIRESLPNEGPQITLDPALNNASVKFGDTLTFDKPVVVDKHDGIVYDEKVETTTYYSYTSATENLVKLTDKDLNEDGKYEIQVNKEGNPANIYIVTKAKNNYYAEYTVESQAVAIKYATNDAVAPKLGTLTLSAFNTALINENKESGTLAADYAETLNDYGKTSAGKGAFNQNSVVTIPTMTFEDNDENLQMSVVVTYKANDTSKNVKLSNFNVSSNAKVGGLEANNDLYVHEISDATFTASNAGYYYVTYIAKDGGNNVSFKTYALFINDTVGPRIEVANASKYNKSVRPGQWFEIPSATAYDNDVLINEPIKTTITGPNGAYELSSDKKSFRPLKTGTYYVTYTATDGAGNPSTSEPYAVEVKASLDEERFFIELSTKDYEEDFPVVTYQENSSLINPFVVLIPKATASDLDMNKSITVAKPSVTDGNGVSKEVVEYKQQAGESDAEYQAKKALYYQFTATTQGEHTVKYSATNEFNLTVTKELVIKIGDTVEPTLVWTDKSANLPTTLEVGSNWAFDLDMLNISDDGSDDTVENQGIKYTITMYDPDGTLIEADDYNYTFDKVGTYKFTVTLTDKAGNTTHDDYRYNIVVEEKEETTNTVNNTTGTILIVTSVVVLGGVVIYFVMSGKKMSANSKKKASKKDEKKDN